jgi:hypothetical protein
MGKNSWSSIISGNRGATRGLFRVWFIQGLVDEEALLFRFFFVTGLFYWGYFLLRVYFIRIIFY